MQDYIFNSRKQAAYRRRKMLFRLFLLLTISGAAVFFGYRYMNGSQLFPGGPDSKQDENLLPLPPINETLPAQSENAAPAANPAPETPQEPQLAEQQQTPLPEQSAPAAELSSGEDTIAEQEVPEEETSGQQLPQRLKWVTHKVNKGETLASIFKQQELHPTLLHKIINSSKAAKALAHINPGQELRFGFDANGDLKELVLQRNRVSSLEIQSTADGFDIREMTRPVEKRYAATTGIIESSLFLDGQKAGLSDTQIMELAQIFGWDIDFALELREGDQFHVIYEEQYLDGEKYKNGPIVAAEFINRGNVYKAVRYTDKDGDTSYYDTDGNAKRRAFIRTPVKFGRISSRFTRKRWHPVLKRWRSHKGVDYAAPRGTPVKATGNGKVVFRGKKGGYGNVIFLRHGGKYTTVYGHLSRFARNLKRGQSVKQGQIIGYVGSTGLATGPHLHYEFRVHGKHQNPLTIKLPKSIRLPKSELARFRKLTRPLLAQLDELRAKTMVASAK
jgi:murein DD-endopeptidase MepM/ murein hydrolase activator NlpD